MAASRKSHLEVEGRQVPLSNLDKALYPSGFTKGQVIDYYIRVSDYLLPHFARRPVTLKRYPNGIGAQHFYEKDAPGFTPDWVRTFPVPRRSGESDINYVLIEDLPTLVWCANAASLELHPFLHRVPRIDTPTSMVFDLDPGEGADVLTCAEVAFLLREILEANGLRCLPKVSGSKGIQVYVPLNTPISYAETQRYARSLAEQLERDHPALVVSAMAKVQRKGKVFIDWSQNADFKTTVGVYSLRAKRSTPYVSMPVSWDELRAALDRRIADGLYFEPEAALQRLGEVGDLFASVLTLQQTLSGASTTAPKPLATYRKKRDFARTSEPLPTLMRSRQGSRRRFVIQKHAASHLHYDLRLEMHGVLKSWAVPKGVPYQAQQNRLAMPTEDHPLSYLDFEGTIPKGEYGGGTVMVWDIGTFDLISGDYYKGELDVFFKGKKLHGEWILRKRNQKGWSLIKAGEDALKPTGEDRSALSGRSMEEIANGAPAVARPAPSFPEVDELPAAALKFIEPMRAAPVGKLPEGELWQYEIKFDGYRALALKKAGAVRLLSRNNRVLSSRFPQIATALVSLPDGTMLDGEIVALDQQGRPSFNILQNYQTTSQPIYYYVFDLLAFAGKDLTHLPLSRRREILAISGVGGLGDPVRISEPLQASAQDVVRAAREQSLEGLVAKRRNSIYEPGARSGAWAKFKLNRGQELVIGGYMPGGRNFVSLLVGYYDGRDLLFLGKVKNGFVPHTRREVFEQLKPLETSACPFANLPEPRNARRGEAITAEVMKKCRWVKPELVAQIEFTDWTAANHLRHSRFVALRDDKDAHEVVRESGSATTPV